MFAKEAKAEEEYPDVYTEQNAINPQQQQQFQAQLNEDNQKYLNQKTIEINNDYAKPTVTNRRLRLPPCCDTATGILQLGLALGIYFLTSYWVSEFDMFPFPAIGLMVMYLVITCYKVCGSRPAQYLATAKIRGEIDAYSQKMKNGNPTIRYQAEAYHYITVTSGSGKNRRSRRKKVTTYNHQQDLIFTRTEDRSDNLSEIFDQNAILRIRSKFKWYKGNQLTETNWNQLVQAERIMVQGKDRHTRTWDASHVPGQIMYQLGFASGIPCYLDKPVMWFFYLFGLSLIYDTLFYSMTAECVYHIQKTIYCENFMGPQILTNYNAMMVPGAGGAQPGMVPMQPGMVPMQAGMVPMQPAMAMQPQVAPMQQNIEMQPQFQQQAQFNNNQQQQGGYL